jgi:5-methylthioadenosine/S-adenosylhomocysteine deaminase
MGPWISKSYVTLDLLNEIVYDCCMDWPCDDQPRWGPPAMKAIRNGRVFDAVRRQAPAMDLLVRDGMIAEIGAPGMAAPEAAEVIDASDRILIPGLINAHTHSAGNLPRSWSDRWTLEMQLNGGPSIRGNQTIEDKHLSALLGAAEMISKGCTACYDLFYEFPVPTPEGVEAVAQAYADVGMRAVIAPMLADRTFYQAVPGLIDAMPVEMSHSLEEARSTPWEVSRRVVHEVLHGWRFDHERITLGVAPTIPMFCTDDYLVNAAAFCRDAGLGLHTHLAESKAQAVYGFKRYQKSITAHLDALGVLSPAFTAAHCVWIDDDDIARLADTGASVAHNPGSNMRLGNGIAATRRMLARGLAVGVGTDSRICSDNLNMFEAMRLASFASRVQGPDHTRWLKTDEAFKMATEGSARALGFGDRLGRLAPGYKADIVFLDMGNLNYVPLNDVANQVVNAEDGTAVASVMVDGRMVYDGGRFAHVNLADLRVKAQEAAERLRNVNAEARELAARLEPVVASFCGGLAHSAHHIRRFAGGEEA